MHSGLLPPKTACGRASWRPRRPPDGPPGVQDGLRTGPLAPKTASGRASWRPRRLLDGPPGVQDGLWTGLLAPKTASGRVSWRPRRPPFRAAKTASERASWRPTRPLDAPLGAQDGLWTGLLASKTALNGSLLDVFALLTVSLCLHDSSLDETSGISTWLPINVAACRLASVALCDGVTLVYHITTPPLPLPGGPGRAPRSLRHAILSLLGAS